MTAVAGLGGLGSQLRGALAAGLSAGLGAVLFAAPVAAAPPPAHLAVVLALDTSGSMATDDPSGDRVASARAVAAQLNPGDALGLVAFSDTASVLLPLQAMGPPAALAAVDGALLHVGAQGSTDLLGGMQAGAQVLAADPSTQDVHILVLLTDGVPDLPALSTPQALQAYTGQLEAAAAALHARGWVLDTVGLGVGVDGAELAQLAQLGGGSYQFAPSSAALAALLLSIVPAAHSAQPPPAPPAPPAAVTLAALPLGAPVPAGGTVELPVEATSAASAPETIGVRAQGLPAGWGAAAAVTVPPGASRLQVPLRVGAARGGETAVALGLQAPAGVRLQGATLRWQLRVRPRWELWVRAHAAALGAGLMAASAAALLAGYAGYVLRVLPQAQVRGRLEVTAPGGEPLGVVRLPRRAPVTVGAAAAGARAVRLPWVPGEDCLFRVCVELDVPGEAGPWRSGLRAWRRPPQAVVYVEAVWPYHLYPGPLPQRRVDLYENTSFGAAGLTFTFRPSPGHADVDRVGTDLLRSLPEA